MRSSGGRGKRLSQQLRVVGTFLPVLPFPFPSPERLRHGTGAVPWPLRPELQPGLGTESPGRFQGGAYCACAGSHLKEGVGREGAMSQVLEPGFEILQGTIRGESKDEKWRKGAAIGGVGR